MTTREYAKNLFSKWSDDDWLHQCIFDKLFWEALNGQRGVNAAGIFSLNFTRWRKAMRDGDRLPTDRDLKAALIRMERRGYIFIDEDTGEGLIRSRIRNDGLDKQPTMFLSALRILAVIDSPKFAAVMDHELGRMVCPDVKGETDQAKRLRAALNKASTEARSHLKDLSEGYTEPYPEPFAEEYLEPNLGGYTEGSHIPSQRPGEIGPSPIPSPRGDQVPTVSGSVSVLESLPTVGHLGEVAHASGEPTKSAPPSSDDEPPRRCPKHENVDDPPLCGNCAEARRANDKWTLTKRQTELDAANTETTKRRHDEAIARSAAIDACPLGCSNRDGYTPSGVVCDHNPARAEINARGRAKVQAALTGQPVDDEPAEIQPEPPAEPQPTAANPDEPPY